MAKKDARTLPAIGRPTGYREEYCELLIAHMAQGGSLESFGAKVPGRCCVRTVYNWLDAHDDFMQARKVGEAKQHSFYEDLGKMMASGQLRRVKSERPVIIDGKVQLGPDGKVLYDREFEPAQPAQAVFIFMTKNMLGWRDKRDIGIHGGDDGQGGTKPLQIEGRFTNMSKAEVEARYRDLMRKALSTVVEGETK